MMRRNAVSLAAALVLLGARPASAQQEFPQTLYWGTGLVDIPVAWVSPLSGDFTLNYMAKRFREDPGQTKLNTSDRFNSQLAFSVALFGRVETGVAFFSRNPEYGFFGRVLLLREEDLETKGGLIRWLPSVAIGARNLGRFGKADRFGVGYLLLPPAEGDPNARHVPDSLHENFSTAGTLYGVATKTVSLDEVRDAWPDVDVSLSVGVGNGLFSDDGGLGPRYAAHSTGGLFYGLKTSWSPARNVSLALLAEHNAWDFNVGASLGWRGLRAGIYATELGASTPTAAGGAEKVYNYGKIAMTLGWQGNAIALVRGDYLRNRAAALESQRERLLADIGERQRRIATLQGEIQRIEAQNLLELEQRRAAAEVQLRAERDALRRLEDRLKRVEQQRGDKPPTTPPQP